MLTLPQWKDLFGDTDASISFDEFYNSFSVSTKAEVISLHQYVERLDSGSTRKQLIMALWQVYLHRSDYLTSFYKYSLRVSQVPFNQLDHESKGKRTHNLFHPETKNWIRNLFHLEILEQTQPGLENLKPFLVMLKDFYLHKRIDYKLVTPSVLKYVTGRPQKISGMYAGLYFRASIMNPYLVYVIAKRYITKANSAVFTPTLGWSSYIYGFLEHSFVTRYVGIDVIPSVCDQTRSIYQAKYPHANIEILCQPSEDVYRSKIKTKYRSKFDLVFFSPPYFQLELYPGNEQSTTRYLTYSSWLEGYWRPTAKLCGYVLKKHGKCIYILSGYGSEGTQERSLEKDMNYIVEQEGFELEQSYPMENRNISFTKHRKTTETVYVFRKKIKQ